MEFRSGAVFAPITAAFLRPWLRALDKPSLPRYHGKLVLPGIKQPVTVAWDRFAVPHVFAADEPDLFFTQGFLHAQERLWQMELSRRFLSGRVAETFGELALPWRDLSVQFRRRTTLDLDFFMRLLGIATSADGSLALLSEDLRARLDAYCSGVNRYIENCAKRLPWEFRLLRHRPEPWRPQDTMIIGKGFALLLSPALYGRLNFFAIAEKLRNEPAKLHALFPGYPEDAPVIAPAIWDEAAALWRFLSGVLPPGLATPAAAGSNSWVVAPERSVTGGALLSCDPHLRLTLPSLWYLMHLKSAAASAAGTSYEVWGASIPGCPLIQIGRNRAIAWGITAAVCDDVEIYRERLHPLEADRYLDGHEWRTFDVRRETIAVRRSRAAERIVRASRHGPVLSDFGGIDRQGEVLALRWTAHEPGEEMRSLYGVNCATQWQQFHDSLRYHGAPTLNLTFADCAGNIGYALAGRVPVRPATPDLLPLPGWDDGNDWRGYIPFEELPRIYNPRGGVIATANNRITHAGYPHYLSHFFEPPYRFRRISDLLAARQRHSVEDLAAMQLDEVSLHARELIGILKAELTHLAESVPALKSAADALLCWDGCSAAASAAAVIFHVFHHRLLINLLMPVLGEELFSAYVEILNQCIAPTQRILADPGSEWFAARSRADLVAASLREAVSAISAKQGSDLSQWRWGEIHTLTMNHSLGPVPGLGRLLRIGPLATGGDGMTINMGFYRHSNPYDQTVGASLRFLADLGPSNALQWVLPSGQSGHPWSPHYRDQTRLWLNGQRIEERCAPGERRDVAGELRLEPPPGL
jgi:penicillin amidase